MKRESFNHEEGFDLRKIVGLAIDGKKILFTSLAFSLFFATLYLLIAPPLYRADLLFEVEESKPSLTGIKGLFEAYQESTSPEAVIEVLKSRMVIGRVVDEFHLDIEAYPKSLPFSSFLFLRLLGDRVRSINNIFSKYSSHSGKIRVAALDLSNDEENLFIVEKKSAINYLLTGKNGSYSGTIGEPLYFEGNQLLVEEIDAEVESQFIVRKASRINVIANLQKNIEVVQKGRNTGIFQATLSGSDPEEIKKILDAVADEYQEQNKLRMAAQVAESLHFLDNQIAIAKESLSEAEDKINLFLQQNGSVNLEIETKSALDSIVKLESKINELAMEESDVLNNFTKEHPIYTTLSQKRKKLEEALTRVESLAQKFPSKEQQLFRLSRDLKSNQEIYLQLLNKAQELNIIKAGIIGNVRILDRAVLLPGYKKPNKSSLFFYASIAGMMLGAGLLFLREKFTFTVQNPEEIEEMGMAVLLTLPYSWRVEKGEKALLEEIKSNRINDDPALQSIKSLKTNLFFLEEQQGTNMTMIVGPTQNIGKSFISLHLAIDLSKIDPPVLIIDGDLRRGALHKTLDLHCSPGVNEYLNGAESCENLIQQTPFPGLYAISRGTIEKEQPHLVLDGRVEEFLSFYKQRFKHVIIDTSPLLQVGDAAFLSRFGGIHLCVCMFDQTTLYELHHIKRNLERNNIEIHGVVFNGYKRRAASYYSAIDYGYLNYGSKGNEKS